MIFFFPIVDRAKMPDWPMAGANPQRTSYTREEVNGRLKPVWYRQIEPFILDRVQIGSVREPVYFDCPGSVCVGCGEWSRKVGVSD
jgi:hypothetical protein